MVYRGKPSAGCENCRKAKKRCTLEQPACARCVKLRKQCVGYRDTSQLQIQDETQAVLRKAEKKRATGHAHPSTTTVLTQPLPKRQKGEQTTNWHASYNDFNSTPTSVFHEQSPPARRETERQPSPLTYSFVDSDGHQIIDDSIKNEDQQVSAIPELQTTSVSSVYGSGSGAYGLNFNLSNIRSLMQWSTSIPRSPFQLPDDVAINMFLNCCTAADGQWSYFHQPSFVFQMSPCLDLAIKACGMAALNNVRYIPSGRELSRAMYGRAIGMLNDALQDPQRSVQDDSLIAVTMLGFYENLTCEGLQSIEHWKAHIQGATQLLKVRGRSQLDTMTGRQLYRELRAQVLVSCIWAGVKPPGFFKEWQMDLATKTTSLTFIGPTDVLMDIAFDFAELSYALHVKDINSVDGLIAGRVIDDRLAQWAKTTMASDDRWAYGEVKVNDNVNVWNGMVHSYACLPMPIIWNMYRTIRILVSRTNELLARENSKTQSEEQEHIMTFRALRKQLTNDICATVPCLLGHAAPAFCSPCVLTTAYGAIWPVFFATTCALERLGMSMWRDDGKREDISVHAGVKASAFSLAAQQAGWLLGRLDYIAGTIGVKWAETFARSLREAIKVHREKAMEYGASLTPGSDAQLEYLSIAGEIIKGVMAWRHQLVGNET